MKKITDLINRRGAAYLRKSRDEGEDTLLAHRDRIKSFIELNNFENIDWFEEIASGGTIESRHEFKKLLNKVEENYYDFVIVVDLDRLTRGDTLDRGIIERAFKATHTVIITTGNEIIDYTDNNQLLTAGVKGIVANYELEIGKHRMKEGKKSAVIHGRPHSGNPPFGYSWDRNMRKAVINEEQAEIYKLILKWFIEDNLTASAIADKLNQMKVPSPRNGWWNARPINYILTNEFHLGYVVYGKFKSSPTGRFNDKGRMIYNINENKNPEEIIKSLGHHDPLKTELQHAQIIKRILEIQNYTSKNNKSNKDFKLLSLVKCIHCKKTLSIMQPETRKPHVKKCVRKTKHRTVQCDATVGIGEEILFAAVIETIREHHKKLFAPIETEKDDNIGSLSVEIKAYEQALLKCDKNIEKEKEMFRADLITIEQLRETISKEKENISDINLKLSSLRQSYKFIHAEETEMRKKVWGSKDVELLIDSPEKLSNKKINEILRSIILNITFKFNDENELEVNVTYS